MDRYINKIIKGDCKEILPKILNEIGNENVILISDPPFNVKYHYKTYKDNLKKEEYFSFLEEIFAKSKSVIVLYPELLTEYSVRIQQAPDKIVSWVYNANTPRQHRDIGFFGVRPDFNKYRQPYKNPNDKRIQERIKRGITGGRLYDWWEIPQVKNVSKEKTNHPCQMPLEVLKRIISIIPDDLIIVDPFCGSGTTLAAAKILGRKYVGIEIDQDYVDITEERLNKINKEDI